MTPFDWPRRRPDPAPVPPPGARGFRMRPGWSPPPHIDPPRPPRPPRRGLGEYARRFQEWPPREERVDPRPAYREALTLYLRMSEIPGADLGKLQAARVIVLGLMEESAEWTRLDRRGRRLRGLGGFMFLVVVALQLGFNNPSVDFAALVVALIPAVAILAFTRAPAISVSSPHEDRVLGIAWDRWGDTHFAEARRQTVDALARSEPPREGEMREAYRARLWLTRNVWRPGLAERMVAARLNERTVSVGRPPARSGSPSIRTTRTGATGPPRTSPPPRPGRRAPRRRRSLAGAAGGTAAGTGTS